MSTAMIGGGSSGLRSKWRRAIFLISTGVNACIQSPCSASPFAPDKQARHGVVPNHAHQSAGGARQPPDRLLNINRKRHADICKQAEAAYEIKGKKAADDCKALQPLITIGQEIVQDEVGGHGNDCACCLRYGKRQM